mmetsp:Transcript_125096/g.365352  ORF Transcript_125096/g.365352 Transcript_125096/m.365352 type:complete len:204 (-) Transcript_125096:953-1564(-)
MRQSVTSTTPGPGGPGAATRAGSPYLAERISSPRTEASSERRRCASPATSLLCSSASPPASSSASAGSASSTTADAVEVFLQACSHELAASQQPRRTRRPSGGTAHTAKASPSSETGSGPAASGQSSSGKLKRRPPRQSVSLSERLRRRTRRAQWSFVGPSGKAFVQVACRAQPWGESEGPSFREKSLQGLHLSCALSSPVPG